MPGVSGVTVVTNARVYYHYTRGCGRIGRPAFPAPSFSRAGNFRYNSGETRREIAKAYSVVIIRQRVGATRRPMTGSSG